LTADNDDEGSLIPSANLLLLVKGGTIKRVNGGITALNPGVVLTKATFRKGIDVMAGGGYRIVELEKGEKELVWQMGTEGDETKVSLEDKGGAAGFLGNKTSKGGSFSKWTLVVGDATRKMKVEVNASGMDKTETLSFTRGKNGDLVGKENIYNSLIIGKVDKTDKASTDNENQENPSKSKRSGREVATEEISEKGANVPTYRSTSKNDQVMANLGFSEENLAMRWDDSVMFKDITHTFKEGMTEFVSGVQKDKEGNIIGKIIAVADTDGEGKFESLKGKAAYLNERGFSEKAVDADGNAIGDAFMFNQAAPVSGWKDIIASGSFFKDMQGTDELALSQATLEGVNFWVKDGGQTFLDFDVDSVSIKGISKSFSGKSVGAGVEGGAVSFGRNAYNPEVFFVDQRHFS